MQRRKRLAFGICAALALAALAVGLGIVLWPESSGSAAWAAARAGRGVDSDPLPGTGVVWRITPA